MTKIVRSDFDGIGENLLTRFNVMRRFGFGDMAKLCFLASFLIKPFYFQASGSLQIADVLMLLSFGLRLVEQGLSFKIRTIDFSITVFVFCVVVIDAAYCAIMQDASFLLYASYYVFNLMVIMLASSLIEESSGLLRAFMWVLFADMLVQVASYFLGFGKWDSDTRFNGTFNDPNQMAYFMLTALAVISVIRKRLGETLFGIWDLVSLFCIIISASTGMMLGYVLLEVIKVCTVFRGRRRIALIGVAFLFSLFVFSGGLTALLSVAMGNTSSYQRIVEKLGKISFSISDVSYSNSIIGDRCLDKVVMYPEYVLLGAGEGVWARFVGAIPNECHSTFVGILFYYGVIPFCFLLKWVVDNFRKADRAGLFMVLAVMIEALFLANQRQPLFWISIELLGLSTSSSTEAGSRQLQIADNTTRTKQEA